MAELPSVQNLIAHLQKCRHTKDIHVAKQLLAFLCEHNLDAHKLFGNCLIPTLVDCGCLEEAKLAFYRLPHKSQHTWNYLICGYIRGGKPLRAFYFFRRMREEGQTLPDRHTFVALLRACTSLKDMDTGLEVRSEIDRLGLSAEPFVGSTLVDMYSKCGSLEQAREVFDQLLVRNVISWTALIDGYAEHGLGEEALLCLERMHLDGVPPDAITCVCGLKACRSIGAIDSGQKIYTIAIKRGWESDLSVGNTLVDMYGKCGLHGEAHNVFVRLPVRDVVSWNALIAQYAEHGLGKEAMQCCDQMQLDGVPLDVVTCVCTLKACGSIRALERGHVSYADIIKRGFEKELYVGGALVDMFVKCGSLQEAEDVFNRLLKKNEVSWTALIAGYAENGLDQEVLDSLERMRQEGVSVDPITLVCSLKYNGNSRKSGTGQRIRSTIAQKGLETDVFVGSTLVDMYSKRGLLVEAQKAFDQLPARNIVSWNALIAGYVEQGFGEEGLRCLKQMHLEGATPDCVTFVYSLKACSSIGALDRGQELHAEILKRGLERDPFVDNTMVDMYVKFDSLIEAQKVIDMIPLPDAAAWAALVSGFAERGLEEETMKCFDQMFCQFESVDAVTLVCCLKACSAIGALEKGREIHATIKKLGFESKLHMGNALIDMYSKCGSLIEAQKVFDELLVKDLGTWNSMMKGYGENHEGEKAVQCFEDMRSRGVKPNAITFTCLLVACSHASLIFKGQEYFKLMIEEHKIEPSFEHFICMIDLLARSGHVYEADRFVAAMQRPPSKEVLMAVISACKIYGEVEIGLKCFQQLVQLNLEDASAYLLIADVYAIAGKWSDSQRMEELRKRLGAMKKPGSVSVEVNRKLHEFRVGDKNRSAGVASSSKVLASRIKDQGHVPNLDFN